MRNLLLVIVLVLYSTQSYSQSSEYVTVDEAFPETETVSGLATMTPEYHVYERRGIKLLIGGLITSAIGGGLFYYSYRFSKNSDRHITMRNGGGALIGVGGGIMISSIIPLTKAKKIKNDHR